jgi:hypothetical protein
MIFDYYFSMVGMKPLFPIENLNLYRYDDLLPFECEACAKTFYVGQRFVKSDVSHNKSGHHFCSHTCQWVAQTKSFEDRCGNCNRSITVIRSERKKSKSGKSFCSRSCAASYNNKHKTKGNRRSKLELWLETQLPVLYPNLDFIFNGKEAINSELDIHIPSLNLAFELNGIFHYEPIFGAEKLASVQNNDGRKFQACLEKGIELAIIDTSQQTRFNDKTSSKYLSIVRDIINLKLCTREETRTPKGQMF